MIIPCVGNQSKGRIMKTLTDEMQIMHMLVVGYSFALIHCIVKMKK